MTTVMNEPDELLDQVLEDERQAELAEFRDRDQFTTHHTDRA